MKPARIGLGSCLWIVTLALIFAMGTAIDVRAAGHSVSGKVVDSVTTTGIEQVIVMALNSSMVG